MAFLSLDVLGYASNATALLICAASVLLIYLFLRLEEPLKAKDNLPLRVALYAVFLLPMIFLLLVFSILLGNTAAFCCLVYGVMLVLHFLLMKILIALNDRDIVLGCLYSILGFCHLFLLCLISNRPQRSVFS